MTIEDREFFNTLLGGGIDKGFGLEYNLFCCEQGILIADSLQSEEKIKEFHKSSWDEQKKMVSLLSDGHSGNTFGMSCRLAIAYLPMTKSKIRDGKIDKILS